MEAKRAAGTGRLMQIREVREVIKRLAEDNAEQFGVWLQQVGEVDPKGAAQLYLSMIEYHIPKLARSEVNASVNHQGLAGILASVNAVTIHP